jgi:large conductance mechanosensitive channel
MGKPDFSALMIGPVALGKFLNAVVNFLVVGYKPILLPWWFLPYDAIPEEEEAPPPPAEPSEEVKLLRGHPGRAQAEALGGSKVEIKGGI